MKRLGVVIGGDALGRGAARGVSTASAYSVIPSLGTFGDAKRPNAIEPWLTSRAGLSC